MKKYFASISIYTALFYIPLSFAGHYTERGDYISTTREKIGTVGDYMQFLIPLSALTYSIIIDDWEGVKELNYSTASTLGMTYLLKYTTNEERPKQLEGNTGHTFPSGHTAFAMAGASYYQMRYGWYFGVPAYLAALFVGYSRVVTKNHNWLDVSIGAAFGIGANLLFTSKYLKSSARVSVTPTDGGAYLSFTTKF